MRELPQQYLDNMTSGELLEYNTSIGKIPERLFEKVQEELKDKIESIEDSLRDKYEDGLVAAYDDGIDEGRRLANESSN